MHHGIHHHEFHHHLGRKIFCRMFGSPTTVAVQASFHGSNGFYLETAVATLISINLKLLKIGVAYSVGSNEAMLFWWSRGRVKGSNFEVYWPVLWKKSPWTCVKFWDFFSSWTKKNSWWNNKVFLFHYISRVVIWTYFVMFILPKNWERLQPISCLAPMWMFPKMGVTPKSSNLIGFSIVNHPFWGTPIFGNTHVLFKSFPPPWLAARTVKLWDVEKGQILRLYILVLGVNRGH